MNMMTRNPPQPTRPQSERMTTPPQGVLRAAPSRPGQQNQTQNPTTGNANRGDELLLVIRQLSDVLT